MVKKIKQKIITLLIDYYFSDMWLNKQNDKNLTR